LRWACLSHLSEENNTPKLALDTHLKILGKQLPLGVAGRYSVSPIFRVGRQGSVILKPGDKI
jgi:hypothetical protein